MIIQSQNIKPGMIIYLPHLKQTFSVKKVAKFGVSYMYHDSDGFLFWATPGFPIPVVGFTNDL